MCRIQLFHALNADICMQGQPNSLPFYTKLDPSKPIALVRLMLQRIDSDPLASGTTDSPLVGRCLAILSTLARHAPSLHALQLLRARALRMNGALDASLRKLSEILARRPTDRGTW
jgi:hypothetical protein